MTEIDLTEQLISELEGELGKLKIFGNRDLKFYKSDIPVIEDTVFEDEEADVNGKFIDKYLPAVVVRVREAEIENADKPMKALAEITVMLKDWDTDMTGYDAMFIALDRIRDYLTSNCGLHETFTMQYPMTLMVNEDTLYPYYAGAIQAEFLIPRMGYADAERFL